MIFKPNRLSDVKSYVLYHANCFDGMGAAYAAWTRLGDSNTEYIPVQYGSNPPEMEAGSDVYIVDFSYSKGVLDDIKGKSANLIIIDHHKTAAEDLGEYPGAIFDMTKSGAVLAWGYFQPEQQVPSLLEYIQDRDLWTWKLGNTKAVMAAMELHKGDFRALDSLSAPDLERIGEAKLMFDKVELANSVKKAVVTTFPGTVYRCAFLNANSLISEVGNHLCCTMDVDFSLSFFISSDGSAVFSFRSIGDFDVSVLAKMWGGGGHKNASGAKISPEFAYTFLGKLYSGATSKPLKKTGTIW